MTPTQGGTSFAPANHRRTVRGSTPVKLAKAADE